MTRKEEQLKYFQHEGHEGHKGRTRKTLSTPRPQRKNKKNLFNTKARKEGPLTHFYCRGRDLGLRLQQSYTRHGHNLRLFTQ